MIPPRVFISYSHDSAEHKQWVLEFATTLRNRGVDAVLDQWDLKPGDDLPEFMEQNLATAEYAIMVCTNRYVEKANAGEGGVGYEKMIMTSSSLKKISNSNVIPIVRENGDRKVPTFLGSKYYIDFTRDEDLEYALDDLLRKLLNAPLFVKPEIGKAPFQSMAKAKPDRTADGVREVIKAFAKALNASHDENIQYSTLVRSSSINRILLDRSFVEAEKKGLVRRSVLYIHFTEKGLQYAIDNALIDE